MDSLNVLCTSAADRNMILSDFRPHVIHLFFTPIQMSERGKNIMEKSLRLEIEEMWTPLREIQAEDAAVKRANEESKKGTQYAK